MNMLWELEWLQENPNDVLRLYLFLAVIALGVLLLKRSKEQLNMDERASLMFLILVVFIITVLIMTFIAFKL